MYYMDLLKSNLKLLVIYEQLSDILNKGEITPRYYNPSDLFEEIHFILLSDDRPDIEKLKIMCGKAMPFIYNLPLKDIMLIRTIGYQSIFLDRWAKPVLKLAETIKPDLVRCYGIKYDAYLALKIKNKLSVPFIISLHTQYDENKKLLKESFPQKIKSKLIQKIELNALRNADYILPVYKTIIPYLEKRKITKYEVCYNVIQFDSNTVKKCYHLQNPPRVIYVGRQIKGKNPENIIRAVSRIDKIELTIIGTGDLHDQMTHLVAVLGIEDRVRFIKSMSNKEIVNSLPKYDIFAANSEYAEISKTVLEAILAGLPVIHNLRNGLQVPEFNDKTLLLVENTQKGYYDGLLTLLNNAKIIFHVNKLI